MARTKTFNKRPRRKQNLQNLTHNHEAPTFPFKSSKKKGHPKSDLGMKSVYFYFILKLTVEKAKLIVFKEGSQVEGLKTEPVHI